MLRELKCKLKNKTKEQLINLIDTIKTSDYDVKVKDELLKEIDYKLGLIRRDDILEDIANGQADLDDIKD